MKTKRILTIMTAVCLAAWAAAGACAPVEPQTRRPVVAGQFYPADPGRLKLAIEYFLKDAVPAAAADALGLIVPHAGYIFSGQICADAYQQVAANRYDVVVILGTNHTIPGFNRISVMARGAYQTPLGKAAVDEAVAGALLKQSPDCTADTAPHLREHSVEVQVPFVQVLFPAARIVPIVIGDPDPAMCGRFGRVLGKVLQGRKALLVASSDLSHYPSYQNALLADREVLEALVKLDPLEFAVKTKAVVARKLPNLSTGACGEAPILAALAAAKSLGATRGVVVSYANSGDAAVGERDRVVGYGAVAFTPGRGAPDVKALNRSAELRQATPLDNRDKRTLLALARETIRRYLAADTVPLARGLPAGLQMARGAFVTLKKRGELRGCIGNMSADVPLCHSVGAMALQAAFNDNRFSPLEASELPELEIEISALTAMKPVRGPQDIVIGRDGVVLIKDSRSAVFLPQVAVENNWDVAEMLEHLCRKAGLPAGSWKEGARFLVFQAEVFSESQLK